MKTKTLLLFFALNCAFVLYQFFFIDTLIAISDSQTYVDMAVGNYDNVTKPFSFRFLYPCLAGLLHKLTHADIKYCFFILNTICLLAFYKILHRSFLVNNLNGNFFFLACSPYVLSIFSSIYLPDLFFSVLLLLFFSTLRNNTLIYASILNLLLWITRESIMLFNVLTIYFCIKYRKIKLLCFIAASTLAGKIASGYVGNFGAANVHQLNDFVYMIGKIPFNFSKNVLGINLWSNTSAIHQPDLFNHAPIFSMKLPAAIGGINEVGIYDFNIGPVIDNLFIFLTIFSILPVAVLALVLVIGRKKILDEMPFDIKLISIYGLICFLIGPALGASVYRLMGYGWPLFLIGVPYLLDRYKPVEKGNVKVLLGIYLAVLWPLQLIYQLQADLIYKLVLVLIAIVFNVAGFRMIRQSFGVSEAALQTA